MPLMAREDLSVHREGCESVGGCNADSDLPDEIISIKDLEWEC